MVILNTTLILSGYKENMNLSSNITLFNKLTKHVILHAFKGPFGFMLLKNVIFKNAIQRLVKSQFDL